MSIIFFGIVDGISLRTKVNGVNRTLQVLLRYIVDSLNLLANKGLALQHGRRARNETANEIEFHFECILLYGYLVWVYYLNI